ncbi:LamG-like jellyroll fold domain-containing protein [Microlunatus flavus]|uniref:Concanavalin A-like lectin/glucanases superfamily protein n=1 Tax=Microlunatus flavus TaxID=1036181 RepID=A0A1H9J0E6_9ACTN|nr:LamG-like jellyroll fold domain-containing protein [Microlunatus flavus]SEQ80252.1 Concanavalin A-like lectin/glucanases superfamily protein [Microlunatus flavus]
MTDAPLWTWRRLVAVTLAKSLLVALVGLAAWGALPALIGWHPTTVSSGSMMPRLHVGDVAVSRPIKGQVPPLSSVLLFDDPDHAGRLRMHRLVRIDENGLLVTRGDANPADDSTPVTLAAVHGIGTLRVPWIALPIVWLREGQWLFVGLTAAALGLLLVVASSGRDHEFGDDEPPEDPHAGPAGGDGDGDDDAPAEPAAPFGAWLTARTALRRGAVVLGAALLAGGLASPVQAAFRATTTSTASLTASSAYTCASVVTALKPYLYYRMDETSSTTTTATDSSGNGRTGLYSSGDKTSTTSKACLHDSGRAMTFGGTSGYLSSPAVAGGSPNTFTLAIWFRTTTTTGGKLIGFGSAQTGSSGNYDRHLYLTDSGRVYFGVYSNANKTLSTTATYNDGAWHLAVATMSTAGMRLYVDGQLLGVDTTTTTGEPGTTSYVRVAFDNVNFWENRPTSPYFKGTLDDAAFFATALTAAQVQSIYTAGTT